MCQVQIAQSINDDIEKDLLNNVHLKNQVNLNNLVKPKN